MFNIHTCRHPNLKVCLCVNLHWSSIQLILTSFSPSWIYRSSKNVYCLSVELFVSKMHSFIQKLKWSIIIARLCHIGHVFLKFSFLLLNSKRKICNVCMFIIRNYIQTNLKSEKRYVSVHLKNIDICTPYLPCLKRVKMSWFFRCAETKLLFRFRVKFVCSYVLWRYTTLSRIFLSEL